MELKWIGYGGIIGKEEMEIFAQMPVWFNGIII